MGPPQWVEWGPRKGVSASWFLEPVISRSALFDPVAMCPGKGVRFPAALDGGGGHVANRITA